jgi:hypothetical protein
MNKIFLTWIEVFVAIIAAGVRQIVRTAPLRGDSLARIERTG